MQTEAGQQLEAIVARKERERLAGEGLFLWGVGNAPAAITNVLARTKRPTPVIFSVMKSRPRAADVAPSRTVVWRRYIDAHGIERPLPPHVLVTSRGDSNSGRKKRHFALMCWSDRPLHIERGEPFNPSAYRNAGGTGAPVGASQVTALLKRASKASAGTVYESNLRAWLVDSYWVRLTDPLELIAAKIDVIASNLEARTDLWTDFVTELRTGLSIAPMASAQGCLI
jgi:hypothetical protein